MSDITMPSGRSRLSVFPWQAVLFMLVLLGLVFSGYLVSMLGWSNFSLTLLDLTEVWLAFDESNMSHQILATL